MWSVSSSRDPVEKVTLVLAFLVLREDLVTTLQAALEPWRSFTS